MAGEDEEVIKAKLSRAKAFHRAIRKSKYKKKAMGLVTSPATKTIRQYRKLKKYFKNHRHELRAPIFLCLWVCWLLAGTLFYGLAPYSNLGLARGFYMALNIGYSIGFGYPSEDSNSYLFFSTCYVLCGASFVGAALGFFAEKVSKDNEDWFSRLEQKKEVEDALRDSKHIVRGKIKAWLFHYAPAVRALSVWLVFVVSMVTYSTLVVKWGFREALYFAISTLSTGGHWSIPNDSPDWLFGLTGGFIMFGVPMMAVAMAQIAYVFISNVDIDEAKATINEVVTKEEIEYLRELGMQTLVDDDEFDGLVDRAEFIILCMVRMGTDPGLISYINQRFMELGFYTGEPLRVEEITQRQHVFVDGKIRRRQSINKNTASLPKVETYSEYEANLMSLRQQDYEANDDDEMVYNNNEQPVVSPTAVSNNNNNNNSGVDAATIVAKANSNPNRQKRTSILRRPSAMNRRRCSRLSVSFPDHDSPPGTTTAGGRSPRMSAVSFDNRNSLASRMSGVSFYDDSYGGGNSTSRMSGVSFYDDTYYGGGGGGGNNNNSMTRMSGLSFSNDDSNGSRNSSARLSGVSLNDDSSGRRLSVSSHGDDSITGGGGNSEEFSVVPSRTTRVVMPQFGNNYSRGQLWSIDDRSVESDLESTSSEEEEEESLSAGRGDDDNDDSSITEEEEEMDTVVIKADSESLPDLESLPDNNSTAQLMNITEEDAVDLESLSESNDSISVEMNPTTTTVDLGAAAAADYDNDASSTNWNITTTIGDLVAADDDDDCGSDDEEAAQSITSSIGKETEAFGGSKKTQSITVGKETEDPPILGKRGSTDSSFLRGLLAKFRSSNNDLSNNNNNKNHDTGSNVTSSSYTACEDEITEPMTNSFSVLSGVISNLQEECTPFGSRHSRQSRGSGGGGGGDIEDQMLDPSSLVVVHCAAESNNGGGANGNPRSSTREEPKEDFPYRPRSLAINIPQVANQDDGPAKLTLEETTVPSSAECHDSSPSSEFIGHRKNAPPNIGDPTDLQKRAIHKETLRIHPPPHPPPLPSYIIRDTSHEDSTEESQLTTNEDHHHKNNNTAQETFLPPQSTTRLPTHTSSSTLAQPPPPSYSDDMPERGKVVPKKKNYARYLYSPAG